MFPYETLNKSYVCIKYNFFTRGEILTHKRSVKKRYLHKLHTYIHGKLFRKKILIKSEHINSIALISYWHCVTSVTN
jgi:hypothetical protein